MKNEFVDYVKLCLEIRVQQIKAYLKKCFCFCFEAAAEHYLQTLKVYFSYFHSIIPPFCLHLLTFLLSFFTPTTLPMWAAPPVLF